MADLKDTVIKLENNGSIHISEDVVASIASLAATEVGGVTLMSANGGVADFINKKSLSRGIKLSLEGENVAIDVFVNVEYGSSIPAVAQKLSAKVKESVESMTGLTVGEINVHVGGISFEK